ncbi:response regulator transcription factor [Adlercreutzia sp. ZJ176]|uniref:response regulator transcription factor n=1 Tax=Adlercreutzia sp. ZJ176 TaxID=2709407 RepID=UPI0013ECE311|nr:helix-turn-helix transcriptional regulator [Adlercreutzia sp. ZJ176]
MLTTTSDSFLSLALSTSTVRVLKQLGFKALLGWHYIVLFSPLLISAPELVQDAFFGRQMVLYFTLAASFGLLALVDRRATNARGFFTSPKLIAFVTVLACLATALSGTLLDTSLPVRMATVVCLGVSEALLMFVWLHYFARLAILHPFRTLALDMIGGGLVALLVGSLVPPANMVVAACLPLVASLSFAAHRGKFKQLREQASSEAATKPRARWNLHEKTTQRFTLKRIVPTVVFAFVFGLVQGGFAANGMMLLMASNAVVFVGIIVAGIIVILVPERPCTHADIDMMHRFALMFFVFGVVGLALVGVVSDEVSAVTAGGILIIAEIAILAGFNLFDFGGLIQGISLVRRFETGFGLFIDSGRVSVYLSLGLGLCAGYFVVSAMPGGSFGLALLFVCGMAIILLVATALVPSFNQDGYADLVAQTAPASGLSGSSAGEPLSEDALDLLCSTCSASGSCVIRSALSTSLIGGAEASKPGEAKGKRGAGDPAALVPAAGARAPASERVPADASAAAGASSVAGAGDPAEAPGERKTTPGAKGSSGKQAASAASAPKRSRSNVSRDERRPWRTACQEIADLYRLSPREQEIFFLIAKGRNAEYVQKELVISIHTAKTHIANIYHKLGVHSVQEMLTLIDAFLDKQK